MKKFFKCLLIVAFIAAASFGYWSYKIDKPLIMSTGVHINDVINHMGPSTRSEERDDGTTIMHFDAIEDQVFKVLYSGYPKRIKLYKAYTLTLYFDAKGYSTGYKIKENPNSSLFWRRQEAKIGTPEQK